MSTVVRLVLVSIIASVLCTKVASAQLLPTDPSLVTGELDNGLHYIVRKHANPPGRAVMWVHLHTGSLNETDRQRGIAHYLEHMAFNGSKNFEPGSLVPYFQSLGMTFGRDQNAFTNFEQTTYQLSLPDTKPETLNKGLLFFSDVVGRLSLLPTEIEAERQIIQEERRRSLSARQRVSDYVLERIAPGSIYGMRDPIGTEETINEVKQSDFKDYYGTWYGASNATVIVLADTDPADVIKVIKDTFGNLPKQPRPTPQPVNVKAYAESFAIVTSDQELRSEDLRIVRLEPARPATTTEQQYRDDLVAGLGTQAMNRRLSDKASSGGTSFINARVTLGNDSNALYTAEMTARPNPGQWKATLNEMALECQRACAFGFGARELDDVKKDMLSGAERAVETEATQQAQGLISRINNNIASGEPTMAAAQRLALLKKHLPTITNEEVGKRFAVEFNPAAVCFIAVLPASDSVPSEAELLDLGRTAFAVKPEREAEKAHATELLAVLPTPGKVAEGSEHAASSVWSGWLSNNVRVHHKFMNERQNEASVRISLIGGELLETADNRGITSAAQLAWSRPATSKLSSTDIRELMTGRKVNVGGGGFGGGRGGRGGRGGGGGGGGADGISLSISGSPEEFETGFQLAYLLLTDPKIESASFTQFQTTTKEGLEESLKNPMMLGMRTVAAAQYPADDARTQPITAEQIGNLSVESSQAWLGRLIKESPIEVTIVGDITREKALELAAKYLGALPSRGRVSPELYSSLRQLHRPAGARVVEKSLDTPTEQAFVFSGFYGADETNIADSRALNMAARILSTRMVTEVREKEQLVYSIGASSRAASTYPGFGSFSASAPTDPPKVQALLAKLTSMYELFAKDGPTQEELDIAKKQMANTYAEQVKDPSYWAGKINQMTFRGASLDDVVAEPDSYQAMTTNQIKDTFAKYYSKQNVISVAVKPNAAAKPADPHE